jgi:hypothetical protein
MDQRPNSGSIKDKLLMVLEMQKFLERRNSKTSDIEALRDFTGNGRFGRESAIKKSEITPLLPRISELIKPVKIAA